MLRELGPNMDNLKIVLTKQKTPTKMQLPNAERAHVQKDKIVEYLLEPAHPDNGGKAAFFLGFGYNKSNWPMLVEALRRSAAHGEVMRTANTAHGMKYIVDGELETPSGRRPMVRMIWIVELGAERPRLVTAYPYER